MTWQFIVMCLIPFAVFALFIWGELELEEDNGRIKACADDSLKKKEDLTSSNPGDQ